MGGLFVLLLITIISLAIDTRPASAHAFLLRTDPPDGSVLPSAPKQILFWFSESINLNLTTLSLEDGAGKTWLLRPHPDLSDPSAVVVYLPSLPANSYRVAWRTVSDEDLHIVSGSVVFGIQQSVSREGSGQKQNATLLAEVAFHWIGLLSFATVIGALIVILFLLPSVRKKFQEEQLAVLALLQGRMILLALWCCLIAFFAGLLMIWEKSITVQPSAGPIQNFNWKLITSLVNIVYIKRELASETCLLAIALLMLYWLKQERASAQPILYPAIAKTRNIILFSFVVLWILFQAMNSHASAFNDSSPIRVIAYAFHLLGAGLWIGGQVALIFLIAPRLRRTQNEQYALAREIYVQFGYVAALGVAILIVTGFYSGGQQIASLDALLLTAYGQALIFKSIFVILTGLIGLWHSSLFHPRVARLLFKLIPQKVIRMIFGKANPPATLRLQLLGGVAIFLVAAFLGSTPPARGPEFEAPVQASTANMQTASSSNMADDLLVNFSIKPNQPGQNFITVGVFNTRRPSPAPIEQVVVKLIPPGKQDDIQLDATLSEKIGIYQISTGAIDLSGDWNASVIVHRTGLEDTVLELPWTVAPAALTVVSRPTFVSNRPLALMLTIVSFLLSILLGSVWLAVTLKPDLFHGLDHKVASPQQEMYQ